MRNNFHTKNNKLCAAGMLKVCTNELSTEIEACISELCWVDVEVTCDVCSIVHCSHTEFWRIITESASERTVNEVISTSRSGVDVQAQTVVPVYHWPADITATFKRHLRVFHDCYVNWTSNQRCCYTCTLTLNSQYFQILRTMTILHVQSIGTIFLSPVLKEFFYSMKFIDWLIDL